MSARSGLGGERIPGPRAVQALLQAKRRHVQTIWVARGRESTPLIDDIVGRAEAARIAVKFTETDRVNREAQVDSAQGVVAIAEPVAAADLDELLVAADAFLIACDGVTDPRNLGAVMRTAESAGATGAVLPRHRSALLTPAAVKAAAGAIEYLPIALVAGIPAMLEQAKRAGVWTVGLDAEGTAPIFDLAVADAPVMLVFGAEGRGLSRLARDRCDVLAQVPMRGRTESLNVSAAAAVACFEVARRRSR